MQYQYFFNMYLLYCKMMKWMKWKCFEAKHQKDLMYIAKLGWLMSWLMGGTNQHFSNLDLQPPNHTAET